MTPKPPKTLGFLMTLVATVTMMTAAAAVTIPALDDNPSTPGDVSGPCDEAENAAKPECAGVDVPADPAPAPAPAPAPVDPAPVAPVDISGPCDEAEHANDPRCEGVVLPTSPAPTDPAPVTPVDISGPCDEAEHANDPRCEGVVVSTVPAPTTPAPTVPVVAPTDGLVETAAGWVSYRYDGQFTLVDAAPADGWRMVIEQSGGLEVDVKFLRGTVRVDVDVEIDDGGIRERVRTRDDADDSEIRKENGVVTRVEDGDDRDDDRGRDDDHPGRDDDYRDDDDRDDDRGRDDDD